MTQYQPGPQPPHPGMTSPQYPAPMRFPTNPPPPPQQRPPSNPWTSPLAILMYVAVAVLIVLSVVYSGDSDHASPAPVSSASSTQPASEPTEASTTKAPATYMPRVSDFEVGIKVREKQCFGEAGCLVTVSIDPQYVGDQELPTTGTIEVTYEISGDESGPVIGSFTVEDGTAHYDKETHLSTADSSVKIRAKVTDVSYSN